MISLQAVPRRHFCFLSSWLFYFHFFLARFIAVVSIVSICLVYDSSIVAAALQYQLPALLFVCVLFVLFCFVVRSCFFQENQSRTKGEGWSTANKFKPDPSPPVISLLAVTRRLFCFGSLVNLVCVCVCVCIPMLVDR